MYESVLYFKQSSEVLEYEIICLKYQTNVQANFLSGKYTYRQLRNVANLNQVSKTFKFYFSSSRFDLKMEKFLICLLFISRCSQRVLTPFT